MKRYIYLRSSLNWMSLQSIEDYVEANRDARPLMKEWLPRLVAAIKKWDANFNIRYFEFRERMKDVTMRNLSQVRNATIVSKLEKSIFKSEKDDFVIYPIDDDDWVSADVFDSACSELDGNEDAVVWPFGFFRPDHVMVTDIEKPIDNIKWMYSNNAILTRKGYEKFCKSCTECDFLEDHREADEHCRAAGSVVKIVHKALSAYNHSPASATKLWGLSADRKSQHESIRSLISNYNQLPAVPDDLKWALPFAKEVWDLISKLKQKRKVFL